MTTVSNIGGTSNRKFLVGKSGLNFESGVDGQSATININSTVVGNVDTSGVGTKVGIVNKTSAYTVVASDLGKIINCTSGSFAVSLTAAATLGAGFNCWIWNTSSTATDAITIGPNGSETIDGASTLILRRGEGLQIVCDGSNWQAGDKKAMRGFSANLGGNAPAFASGESSVAIGGYSTASGSTSIALGYGVTASGQNSTAIGPNGTTASASNSTAVGSNSGGMKSQAVTGAGAMALGGSYASGTDSFAAAIANNTISYGATGANSVAIGFKARAGGAFAVAVGRAASATGYGSLCVDPAGTGSAGASIASNTSAIAIGNGNTASGGGSCAIGYKVSAIGAFSLALGSFSYAAGFGKQSYASGQFTATGDAQTGKMVLFAATTTAAVTALTSDAGAAGTTNQVILPDDSTYAFSILVVARRTDVNNESAGFKFEGAIDRNTGAATTAIVGTVAKTILAEDTVAWDCNVSADTTNGGLKIEVTGEAGKTIRWVATVWTTEVTG